MKIAIITPRPISLDSGADSRNYHLAHNLSKKHQVKTYVPSISNNYETNEPNLIQRLRYLLLGKIPYVERLKKSKFTEKELAELQQADIIQLEEMSMYYVLEKYLKNIQAKIVLDTHNIDYVRFLSETDTKSFIEKNVGKILAIKLKKMEIEAIKKIDHVLVCSDMEKQYFSQYIPSKNITVIPNGADISMTSTSIQPKTNQILFMGLLSYPANALGLKYYIEKIHPKVINTLPEAQLVILGKGAPAWLEELAKKDKTINLKGFVKDVRPYIDAATTCICPVFSGSGTRLKILEYMALGKPVVSTTIGAEGIEIKNGVNILLADNPEDFAAKIISLLTEKNEAKKLGENARLLIEKEYRWENLAKKLITLYEENL